MGKNLLVNRNLIRIIQILFALFGLFILYQILRKMLGGSWSVEDIILGLLIFNIGVTFTIGMKLTRIESDHIHLNNQFGRLVSDFKSQKKSK